jgi:hypothetical protein
MNESNADVSQTDLCGYLRIQGEGMDIGCYEFGDAWPPKEENENDENFEGLTPEEMISAFSLRMV